MFSMLFSSQLKTGLLLAFVLTVLWYCTPPPPSIDVAGPQPPSGPLLGKEEACFSCHEQVTGLSAAHDPELLGCTPCHGGDPLAFEKETAHQELIAIPGNLKDVYQTCGTTNCHGEIAQRVNGSLMATMSGVVAVDKFAFGESPHPDLPYDIRELGNSTAAELHLRHLCASCHLGREKTETGPIHERSRGGGCNACHLNYATETPETLTTGIHPQLNLQVSNDHCFGCHSRSGRISTNFEGWHETTFLPEEVKGQPGYRQLQDGRIMKSMPPDVHHTAGLACIDCHHPGELMGDGTTYLHEEEAVKTQCVDCHFSGPPTALGYEALPKEYQTIVQLRKWYENDRNFLQGGGSGLPLVNVWQDQDAWKLTGKLSGQSHPLRPPASICEAGNGHADLTCSACHTGWAPQCIGCHNTFQPDQEAFDLLDRKPVQGKWEEELGVFFAELPTLGVVENLDPNGKDFRKIQPFIPGMIMRIDHGSFTNEEELLSFHRLFAPAAPHTTQAKGRDCASCHLSSLALGLGRGELNYQINGSEGYWTFRPEYANEEEDGLPQDAWTPFLGIPAQPYATRTHARPFNPAEQARILTVGACLTCHDQRSQVMESALEDFQEVLDERSSFCVLPVWDWE
jgi:hypothetical protein